MGKIRAISMKRLSKSRRLIILRMVPKKNRPAGLDGLPGLSSFPMLAASLPSELW
jgi:hypothetical protein